ncbi:MAG: LytTR family DNA-binding domain-containing protein [Prolixibacteraceae bacterium]
MNCIAIDDEPLALDLLKDYTDKIPFLKLERTFSNPMEGLSYLQENKVDMVFLDVELPYVNGIEFVKCLQSRPQVIFTTAFEKYALAGYDLEITDYLMKPIMFERFLKATNKAYNLDKLSKKETRRTELPAPEKENQPDFILVKTGYSTLKVNLNDILYIEGLKDYIKIHLAGRTILTLNSLKKFQEILPEPRFVRVHRSCIVPLEKIDSIQRNRIVIGKNFIPVGENYKNSFKDKISYINL